MKIPSSSQRLLFKNDFYDNMRMLNGQIFEKKVLKKVKLTKAKKFKKFLMDYVIASHNRKMVVKKELNNLLAELDRKGGWGVNIGSGFSNYHDKLINLDIAPYDNVDIVTMGKQLPFKDNSLDLVIAQEVIEHVSSPTNFINEIHRVLKNDGVFYCQAPCIIGYHPTPTDYWRFTREAWEVLFNKPNWEVIKIAVASGPGTALFRIMMIFFAVMFSNIWWRLYLPAKLISGLLLSPIKLFDLANPKHEAKHRLVGGYYCVARKK